ncbi:MAG: hypothetical protein IJN03_01545 [Bacilli bacterium]|nr:hypothetical protein [Bacilli bacterium]
MMNADNQEYNFNNSYAMLNTNILELYKRQYQQLAPITCKDNMLFYNGESFPLGYFRLNQITVMICELSAKEFYETIKLLASIENNLENEDYYLANINLLLEKNVLSEEDKNIINDFVKNYINLKNHEDFLAGVPTVSLSKYRQIVNNVLYLCDPTKLTEGQKIINDAILAESENFGGRNNGITRVLKNPDIPNMAPDEEQPYSKAGFASIILIIYTIINAAIILAIKLIK